jgi:hypothetical protein
MKDDKLMAHDPLSDADAILSEEYYGRPVRGRDRAPAAAKPTHYKVICISMYNRDIEELEAKVAEAEARAREAEEEALRVTPEATDLRAKLAQAAARKKLGSSS